MNARMQAVVKSSCLTCYFFYMIEDKHEDIVKLIE